jgi:hypothetical protein
VDDPRERVSRLVAAALRSNDPSVARYLALEVCRLIDQHKLLRTKRTVAEDLFGVTFSAPAPPATKPVRAKRDKSPDDKLIPITMVERVICPICSQPLKRNSFGMWSRGEILHTTCYKTETGG